MTKYYISTRDVNKKFSPAEAIIKGISPDGGLFVPNFINEVKINLDEIKNMNYQDMAMHILKNFLYDFNERDLKECVIKAYDNKFDNDHIAPLKKVGNDYFLELFHGPTLAFKDMALSILPQLLKKSSTYAGINNKIVILTATSGDTGKAALQGFSDVEGTEIIVFYPKSGVSKIQEMQMITQEGTNTHVVGIEGNFDDAQNAVKYIFNDNNFNNLLKENNCLFSSANSINIGRLIPQVVYYFYSYFQLVNNGEIKLGEKINFTVPTGNFGNILAGYYAMKIGLPINKLICASNQNNILYDFFSTGSYNKNREFIKTVSPSMDILISSNLERLLFDICNEDSKLINNLMQQLSSKGIYDISNYMKDKLDNFEAGYATEEETINTIKSIYEKNKYVVDPHTAVAYKVYQDYVSNSEDYLKNIILSTASPFKFTRTVYEAIWGNSKKNDFELINELAEKSNLKIPTPLIDLVNKEVLHNNICKRSDIKNQIKKLLNI